MKIQINQWEGYKFESHLTAETYEGVELRQLDDKWDTPGARFDLTIPDSSVDGGNRYFRMEGAEISYSGGYIAILGFVQPDYRNRPSPNEWRKEYWEVLES